MIKALNLTIYTTYRDFACDSADISNLPHDVADGSTAITRDTQQEFVYCKKEDEWREEKRPTPPFVWLGEYLSLESVIHPMARWLQSEARLKGGCFGLMAQTGKN